MKILWVEDDLLNIQVYIEHLRDHDFFVHVEDDLQAVVDLDIGEFDLVIIDVLMKDHQKIFDPLLTRGGFETGKELARRIHEKFPKVKIIGCSNSQDENLENWFNKQFQGYLRKSYLNTNDAFIRRIRNIVKGEKNIKAFIVHGHDTALLDDLKEFLVTNLKFPLPIILKNEPSFGRTIIEKFEDYSNDVDIVFVLLTPDDDLPRSNLKRPRQNVIFELGYFYSHFERRSGKIILLYKGNLDIPSDMSGIIYINVDDGIQSISEIIRNELEAIV